MALLSTILMALLLAFATPRQVASPAEVTAAPASNPAADAIDAKNFGLWIAARLAPPDAKLLIHIDNAAQLRRDLAPRPLASWLTSLAGESAVSKVWASLATSLKRDEAELFDGCFGRSCTFVARNAGEWVVVTDLGEERTRELLRTLQVRVREPRFGLAISELPEQEVLLAADGDRVAIGPSAQSQLLFDVLQRWDAAKNAPGINDLVSLAISDEFSQRLAELPPVDRDGNIAAFIRHDPPMGGCSLIVANVHGDDVKIKHAARFDNPPFLSANTRLTCDFSPLALFANRSLVTIMQPRDVGDGPMETYLNAGLGVGLISAEMRGNLADRRILVVGEQDARQLSKPANILTTTFVACLEVKDASKAGTQLDAQMSRLAHKLNDLGRGAFLIQLPDCGTLKACDVRHADLGAAGEWFTGGFPVMKTVSLNWAIAQTPRVNAGDLISQHDDVETSDGPAWFVVGSNPQALKEAIDALGKPCSRDPRMVGRFDSCGAVNGLRLGHHMESWSDEAQEFAQPEKVNEVRSTLRTFANLALGVKDCRWQMARPTPDTMRLDMQVQLAPAETAGK